MENNNRRYTVKYSASRSAFVIFDNKENIVVPNSEKHFDHLAQTAADTMNDRYESSSLIKYLKNEKENTGLC